MANEVEVCTTLDGDVESFEQQGNTNNSDPNISEEAREVPHELKSQTIDGHGQCSQQAENKTIPNEAGRKKSRKSKATRIDPKDYCSDDMSQDSDWGKPVNYDALPEHDNGNDGDDDATLHDDSSDHDQHSGRGNDSDDTILEELNISGKRMYNLLLILTTITIFVPVLRLLLANTS